MSQGLFSSAAGRAHGKRLIHPKTRLPLEPVGFIKGRPVWPILGASEDDPDDDANEEDEDTDDEDEGASEDEKDKGKKSKVTDASLTQENARRRTENKRLLKEKQDLEARLKEYEDADKSDLEKATGTVNELTARAEKAEGNVGRLTLENAFLLDNTYDWANPKTALRLVDLSEVEIDDDGKVTGLDEALKALAESEPYLLKGKDDEDEDDDEEKPSAGQPPKGKQKPGKPNRAALEKRYPALRR